MNNKNNIELRSEKVRNLIGEIPPIIIRAGISVIFLIILILLTASWVFKFEYTIKTTATIVQQDSIFIIHLRIPANEINRIWAGQKVILNFDNIPNLYNKKMRVELQTIPNEIQIAEDGGFYIAKIDVSNKTKTEAGKELSIKQETTVNAEIITGKISLFDRIAEPVKTLFNKRD